MLPDYKCLRMNFDVGLSIVCCECGHLVRSESKDFDARLSVFSNIVLNSGEFLDFIEKYNFSLLWSGTHLFNDKLCVYFYKSYINAEYISIRVFFRIFIIFLHYFANFILNYYDINSKSGIVSFICVLSFCIILFCILLSTPFGFALFSVGAMSHNHAHRLAFDGALFNLVKRFISQDLRCLFTRLFNLLNLPDDTATYFRRHHFFGNLLCADFKLSPHSKFRIYHYKILFLSLDCLYHNCCDSTILFLLSCFDNSFRTLLHTHLCDFYLFDHFFVLASFDENDSIYFILYCHLASNRTTSVYCNEFIYFYRVKVRALVPLNLAFLNFYITYLPHAVYCEPDVKLFVLAIDKK